MYETFKNFELHRHQISTRVDKSLKDYADDGKNNADNISSTIFSACVSLVIAYISEEFTTNTFLIFVLFLVAYPVAFLTYKFLLQKCRKAYYNTKRHGNKIKKSEIKELLDNFDHIACDNNLVAKKFLEQYEQEDQLELRTFEFYELLYYAKVSAEKTMSILEHSNSCINTLSNSSRIDLHRIYNQLNMLLVTRDFLLANCLDKRIDIHDNLRLVLIDQIHEVAKMLEKIQQKCDEFRDAHFSDIQVEELKNKHRNFILQSSGEKATQ